MNLSSSSSSLLLDEFEYPSRNNSSAAVSNTSYVPYSERPETYIVPMVFAVIFIVGVLGNGTLVLIFARHKNMRNVPNTYILSLALGDLLVILTCVPFTSTVYTVDSWPYGQLICKISEAGKDVSIGVSVFTLTVLSADRFFAIVDPLKKLHSSIGGRRATRFTLIVTCAVWTLAVLFAVPALLFSYIRIFERNDEISFKVCYPYPEHWGSWYPRTVIMAKFLVYYVIPLTVIGCFYVLMAQHLFRSTRNMPGEAQGQARQIRARKKVAKTVLAFVVVFALCFFPQHVYMLWFYNNPNSEQDYNQFWHLFRIVGFVLSFLNSCVNPIALYCVSSTFRKYFDLYLFRICRRRKKPIRKRFRSSTLNPRTLTSTKKDGTQPDTTLTTLQTNAIRKQAEIIIDAAPECSVTTLINGVDIMKNIQH